MNSVSNCTYVGCKATYKEKSKIPEDLGRSVRTSKLVSTQFHSNIYDHSHEIDHPVVGTTWSLLQYNENHCQSCYQLTEVDIEDHSILHQLEREEVSLRATRVHHHGIWVSGTEAKADVVSQ